MTTNTVKTMDGYRSISIHKNEVKISTSREKTDNKAKQNTSIKKQYQIVNGIDLGEHKVVQCLDKGEITVFSISQCQKICQVPQTAVVKYSAVGNELFVKVVDDEKESIYDEVGNLIESDSENQLAVVFKGCGVVIKKTSKKTGRENYYTFEGRLVG